MNNFSIRVFQYSGSCLTALKRGIGEVLLFRILPRDLWQQFLSQNYWHYRCSYIKRLAFSVSHRQHRRAWNQVKYSITIQETHSVLQIRVRDEEESGKFMQLQQVKTLFQFFIYREPFTANTKKPRLCILHVAHLPIIY